MPKTLGRWEQQTGFTDGELFIGTTDFYLTSASGAVTIVSSAAGLLTTNIAASLTVNLFANISTLLRTGQLATASYNQEEFGTAAAVPGPSTVAGTSDPLNLPPGFPPWTSAVNPALTGGYNGPIPKGFKPIWVNVIYEVDTGAITSVTFGLTKTVMPASGTSAAPAVTNIITLGANSLPTAANTAGQATRTRIAVPTANQLYLNADGSSVIANVNFVTPAANTVKFYGIIIGCHFNYN